MCMACSSTEQRFLEASLAFQAGKPIVSDEQYDALKDSLRKKNSIVVQQVSSKRQLFSSNLTCSGFSSAWDCWPRKISRKTLSEHFLRHSGAQVQHQEQKNIQ